MGRGGGDVASPDDLPRRVKALAAALERMFGRPEIRPRGDPLDVLIETILSQSTNDRNRERAYRSLRERFPRWEDALAAGPKPIRGAIRSGGLSRQKSVRIHALLERLAAEHGKLSLSEICAWPEERVFEWLGAFEGVGSKTIAVVLMFACGRDICPVDTHVHRIVRRLGLVRPNAGAEEAFSALRPHIPPGEGPSLHLNLLRFGRTRCTARSPGCEGCPFRAECRYERETGIIRPGHDGGN